MDNTKSKQLELFQIIADQAGVKDALEVEKAYYACKGDVSNTILTLMNVNIPKQRHEKEEDAKNIFDDFRVILEEKDAIFHNLMNKTT